MNKGMRKNEIYRELTPAGMGLCAATGAVAEGITFVVLGIRLGMVPLPVLIFLWGLYGILVSGVLFLFDAVGTRIQEIREWIYRIKDADMMIEDETAVSEVCLGAAPVHEPVYAQIIYRDIWNRTPEVPCETQRKAS